MNELFSATAVIFFVMAVVAATKGHAKAWRGILIGLAAMAFFLGLGSPTKPPETYVTAALILIAALLVGGVWAYAHTARKEAKR